MATVASVVSQRHSPPLFFGGVVVVRIGKVLLTVTIVQIEVNACYVFCIYLSQMDNLYVIIQCMDRYGGLGKLLSNRSLGQHEYNPSFNS